MAQRSNPAELAQRVNTVLSQLLAGWRRTELVQWGAGTDDPKDNPSSSGWGVSARQMDNYIAKAKDELASVSAEVAGRMIKDYVVRHEELYRRAVKVGDITNARLNLESQEKLLGFLKERHEISGNPFLLGAVELKDHEGKLSEFDALPEDD